MNTLNEIENAITQLSKKDIAILRKWFEKFDNDIWDQELENDVISGKLDHLAEQALSDLKAGKCRAL